MLKKIIWALSLASLLLALVFIFGFSSSINISSGRAKEDNDLEISKDVEDDNMDIVEGKKEIFLNDEAEILIVGDSIGFGIGDQENLDIGKRYVALSDQASTSEVEIANISVPGYETDQLVALLASGEYDDSISNANLIIVSIGGNDLNRLEYSDDLTLNIVFQETLAKYKENLELFIEKVKSVNPLAQLAMIGLYNPYGKEDPQQARFLLDWNYETRLILNSDPAFAYIPTYEQFDYHLDQYLAPDNFHPNAAGYQAIAEELYSILN